MIADAAQIGAGPVEQIAFGKDDPRAFRIETEMVFNGGRQFERVANVFGGAVRDGKDKDLRFTLMTGRR